MLDIARKRHPKIEYIEADMRTIQFDRQFDVIAIPDSIANKVSEKDLLQVMTNSVSHLKTGGIFIVVAKP